MASNYDEIKQLRKFFSSNKIQIVKYNFSLDDCVQNSSIYDGYLQIGTNDQLKIVTLKPREIQKYVEEGEDTSYHEDD